MLECLECNSCGEVLSQGVPPLTEELLVLKFPCFSQTSSGPPSGTVQRALERNLQLLFPRAVLQPAEEQWKASEILISETQISTFGKHLGLSF